MASGCDETETIYYKPGFSPRLAFLFFPSFFCPPLISSSCLPSFFSFYYSFPIRFLSFLLLVSPFLLLFLLSFLPLFYFPDFFLLFLSSLFLIFFFFLSSLTQNDDFLWCSSVYSQGRMQGGVQVNPLFFQINYIHSMAWHACLACK